MLLHVGPPPGAKRPQGKGRFYVPLRNGKLHEIKTNGIGKPKAETRLTATESIGVARRCVVIAAVLAGRAAAVAGV